MTHDPMLDGITRWTYEKHPSFPAGLFYLDGDDHAPEGAEYVLFSDLPALIAAVREDERGKAEMHNYHMPAWTSGYAAALDAAEQAVATWISYTFPANRPGWTGQITAAIRALKEKP